MKPCKCLLVFGCLLLAAVVFYGCQLTGQPVAVVQPPAATTLVASPAAVVPAPAPPPKATLAPVPVEPAAPAPPTPPLKPGRVVVSLDRADSSGIFVLPAGLTWRDVAEVYLDGRPVSPDRCTITGCDELDIYDARPDSKVTAVIIR